MSMDDALYYDPEDDERTVAYIKSHLPAELKNSYTDDDLYYLIDLIADYYTTSGCLEVEPDEDGYINIDEDEIVRYLLTESKKDGIDKFSAEGLLLVVQAEMEYSNSMFDDN